MAAVKIWIKLHTATYVALRRTPEDMDHKIEVEREKREKSRERKTDRPRGILITRSLGPVRGTVPQYCSLRISRYTSRTLFSTVGRSGTATYVAMHVP
jgi:hypothetical protein